MSLPSRLLTVAAALALTPFAAAQTIIPGVTASTDMGSGAGTNIMNTVNGVGLVGGVPSLTADHDPSTPGNSWIANPPTMTGAITFDLGGAFPVNGLSFWNQNDGGPGLLGVTGIANVLIEFSTDGVLYNLLPGAPGSFSQVMTGGGPPEIFAFAPVNATHIRFNVLSNHGDPTFVGFAETHFSQVPAPGVLALLAVAGLGRTRRRRR